MLQARMLAPGQALFEAIATAALGTLPERMRTRLGAVTIEIAELADDAMLDARDIMDPFGLTSPRAGLPLHAAPALPVPPATLRLYRRALIDRWVDEGAALDQVVGDAVRHEARHMIEHAIAAAAEEPVRRLATG